jgi:hypothetical protein
MRIKRIKAPVLASLVLLVLVFAALFTVNFENIFSLVFHKYTGYEIKFTDWDKSLSGNNLFTRLTISKDGMEIKAERAELFFDLKRALRQREAFFRLELKGVNLLSAGGKAPFINSALAGMLTGERMEYDVVRAKILLSGPLTVVEDLLATSKGLRFGGSGSFNKRTDQLIVSFKIELSPGMAAVLPEEVRNNVLSLEDDGWYATVIDYKGPAILVKSLYAVSI